VRIHRGDENNSTDVSKVMEKFRILTTKGTSVLFIHHHRKESAQHKKSANSVRGSSDILAGIDCLLLVEKSKDNNTLIVEQAKLRQQQAIEPFSIEIKSNKETGEIAFVYEGEHNPNKTAKEEVKNEIIFLLSQNIEMTKKDIVDALSEEYGLPTITSALKELEPEKINKLVGASNKFSYSLKK
jgi:RecA-family ATPase